MAGSAHIVTICVRRSHRGQGVGELLLIGAIERAVARGATEVTLEVRPSNVVARNLYRKYGFTDRGVRKSYYSDNREDAVIMTTDPVQETPFAERFAELERRHRERWGRHRERWGRRRQ
jgi:ribosomal-protein-alanine N-acetyltransferase